MERETAAGAVIHQPSTLPRQFQHFLRWVVAYSDPQRLRKQPRPDTDLNSKTCGENGANGSHLRFEYRRVPEVDPDIDIRDDTFFAESNTLITDSFTVC